MLRTNIPSVWQQAGTNIGLSCLVGMASWLLLLLSQAYRHRSGGLGTWHSVDAGPLVLHTFSKQAASEGFIVQFTFEPGLLWFGLAWVALGVCITLLRYRGGQPAK